MARRAASNVALTLQDLPEEILENILDQVEDSGTCASMARLGSRLAAGWRLVKRLFFAEPKDKKKFLDIDVAGLRGRMSRQRTVLLKITWPTARTVSQAMVARLPHQGRLRFKGGWAGLLSGLDAAETPSHLAHLEVLHSEGQPLEARKDTTGPEGSMYLPNYLEDLPSAMPRLRTLSLDAAVGPILYGYCMDVIGRCMHLETLRLTPHPGGDPFALHNMADEKFRETFFPQGIDFWREWVVSDGNMSYSAKANDSTQPFSQPQLHRTLKTLDLSGTAIFGHANYCVWQPLACNLAKFDALEVLDLSYTKWGGRVPTLDGWPHFAVAAMCTAMLSLPTSLRVLDLTGAFGADLAVYCEKGVFRKWAALPELVELHLDELQIAIADAIALLRACVGRTELYVSCGLFELPAGNAAARSKEMSRLLAVQKRLNRNLS